MKLIDKYILKNFLSTFFFTVIIFVVVICMVDFTENHDDFLREKVPYSEVFGVYYLNYSPYLANMLSPIMVFIATVVITSRFAARTEIIAMFNSGMSFARVLFPYIIGSGFIGILTFVMIGWVIPNANKKRIEFQTKYLDGKEYFDGQNFHMKIAPDQYFYIKNYNSEQLCGYDFTLESINGHKLVSKLKAGRICWNQQKHKWSIEQYAIRKIVNEKEYLSSGYNLDTTLAILPEDFEIRENLNQMLTMGELEAYINKLKERGSEQLPIYLTEKYERFTYPFAIVILTIIGVIVSARKSRQGTGFQIAFGFLLAMIYILFVIMSRNVAQVGSVGPLMAAWTPNIIFSVIGYIMYKTLPR